MPFAIVAVALLVIASAYGAISKLTEDSEKSAESVKDDINSLNSAVDSLDAFMRTGLGELIFDISTDKNGGTLDKRVASFNERLGSWMDLQFPRNIAGTDVTVTGYEITLDSVVMRYSDPTYPIDGYRPSYLQANGTMEVRFGNGSGSCSRTVPVVSDGSCALPLTTEVGSMFENAVGSDGSILSQMMTYQLTCLAQTKVINGYGLNSSAGPKGTNSLITKEEVEQAYSDSLKAIQALYLRNGDDTGYLGDIDLAKKFLAPEGYVDVDLNMVYAHALYAIADDIVLKWFDFVGGSEILSIYDAFDDAVSNAFTSMFSWLTGKNKFSAEEYIRKVCGDLDYGLYTGKSFRLEFPGNEPVPAASIILEYPTVDLMGSRTVSNFVRDYRSDGSNIMTWLKNIVNGAIDIVAKNENLGNVRIYMEDDRTYAECLAAGINGALKEGKADIERIFFDQTLTYRCPDEFYASIYDAIARDSDTLFGYSDTYWYDTYRPKIVSMLTAIYNRTMDPADSAMEAERQADLMFTDGSALKAVIEDYQESVSGLLAQLEPLRHMDGNLVTHFQKVCRALTIEGILFTDLAVDVFPELDCMMDDFMLNLGSDPFNGCVPFPYETSFGFVGDGTYIESVGFEGSSHPHITIGSPNTSRSTHQAAFDDDDGASFCTVIPVTVKDTLGYRITSSGTLMSALGIVDSAYNGTTDVEFTVYIPAMSGWGLNGVTYRTDNTLLDNAVEALVKALKPLVEPLMKVLNTAQELLNVLNRISIEINRYIMEVVTELYERLMKPVEVVYDLLVEKLGDRFCQMVVDKGMELGTIIDITLSKQIVGFTYLGWEVLFIFNLSTLDEKVKDVVKMQVSGNIAGNDMKAFIDIKAKGSKNTASATGGFSMKARDWMIEGTIDPKMDTNGNLLSITGIYKSLQLDMVLPAMTQYRDVTLSLADIDFMGDILQNIPSPIPGTKVALDAGIDIRYSAPIESGVLINEVELNPAGTDTNREWIEIVNLTAKSVNLGGWYTVTSKGKTQTLDDVSLSPGARTVVEFKGAYLNNSDETVTLYDPSGNVMDTTPKMRDEANDEQTYQRAIDGCTKWVLTNGTPGSSNKGALLDSNGLITGEIIDMFKKSAKKAMIELDHVTDTEGLSELFRNTLLYTLDLGMDKLSSCVVEASVFADAKVLDALGTVGGGFRIYLSAGQTMAKDVLKYVVGRAAEVICNIDDPYGIDLGEAVENDVFIGITTFGTMSTPDLMKKLTGHRESVDLGIDIRCNLAAVNDLFGDTAGDPAVTIGVYLKNCPTAMVPPALKPTKGFTHDLWVIKATFTRYK
ncbi:MAG: lamin tail domain-containing protein [archaeon]|nr:lamin tail domain-containing protein [archaeon]